VYPVYPVYPVNHHQMAGWWGSEGLWGRSSVSGVSRGAARRYLRGLPLASLTFWRCHGCSDTRFEVSWPVAPVVSSQASGTLWFLWGSSDSSSTRGSTVAPVGPWGAPGGPCGSTVAPVGPWAFQ